MLMLFLVVVVDVAAVVFDILDGDDVVAVAVLDSLFAAAVVVILDTMSENIVHLVVDDICDTV